MSNSTKVATAGAPESRNQLQTDEQLAAFWSSIVSHMDAARAMARLHSPRQNVDDVVHTAAILFHDSFKRLRKPKKYPKTERDFCRMFLAIVRNHAHDCVRSSTTAKRPDHAFWGLEPEPIVGGRKHGDRPLDRVFARNDAGEYDAPAPPIKRDKDDGETLDQILRAHVASLPRMQRQVIIETFFQGRKRAEVSARNGISVHTYDNHMQAGYKTLRCLLLQEAERFTAVDRTIWYDLIEDLSERYEAAHAPSVSRKVRERSKVEADRSRSEGDGDKSVSSGAA